MQLNDLNFLLKNLKSVIFDVESKVDFFGFYGFWLKFIGFLQRATMAETFHFFVFTQTFFFFIVV